MTAWRILRALAFRLVFYAGSVPILLIVPLVALIGGQRMMVPYAHGWSRFHRWAAATFLGVRTRFEGTLPDHPVLYAAKHEAMYETVELSFLLHGPAVVLKRELMRIPLWGYATKVYGAIAVDRDASASALRRMVKDAGVAKAQGRSVIVYPEGTRVPHGATPPLRSGFAGLYKTLGYPVVPIATDSGRFVPRRGWPRAGVVTIRLGEEIPAGLPRKEAEARVHAAINVLAATGGEG
ncbi:MAG: lysophospholipid acyltransferase family protein [Sphingomonas adhaesiva]|uniref:lysophospholipid acyltransferase family protein n=1 Tax=Sphingomonas adhaesiva TaxID=28212 RepID=UPI002FFD4ECA